MRTFTQILKQESPTSLAREFFWRLQKKNRQKEFLESIERKDCPVVFRRLAYYKPDLGTFNEASRALITAFADEVCEGRYPFLGYGTVDLGPAPQWNLDWISGRSWPADMPIENRECMRFDGSDVKVPYELSRLQFLPVLGKAYVLTRERRYRETAKALLTCWLDKNPIGIGVNWSLAMEAALRGMSICFLVDLLWPFESEEQAWLDAVTRSLWQHLVYIETHLEFSHLMRSNHYLSNIVGLHCLTAFLEGKGMEEKRNAYRRQVEREILLQVYEDGGDYEASTGYQVLVAQMFTCCLLLARADSIATSERFLKRLGSMHHLLAQLAGQSGQLPQIGDCDDGRIELLIDDLKQMSLLPVEKRNSLRVSGFLGLGRALFGTEGAPGSDVADEDAKWYGLEARSKGIPKNGPGNIKPLVFPQSGIARLGSNDVEAFFFAIPNGIEGKGSHTHNDKLSLILRLDGQEVLTDSGTGTYTRDRELRNSFRMTSAHNTASIDETEQNVIDFGWTGLFRIGNQARVSPIEAGTKNGQPWVRASHNGYSALGLSHSRTVLLNKKARSLTIEDRVEGAGKHKLDIYFQLAPHCEVLELETGDSTARCLIAGPRKLAITVDAATKIRAAQMESKFSATYGSHVPSQRLRFSGEFEFPAAIVTRVDWA